MLLVVQDGAGNAQMIIAHGQEAVADHSGTIAQTSVSQMALPANLTRSGWFLQNNGEFPMQVNELGGDATLNSFTVPAGYTFPPANFPITTNAINVAGTAGDN